MKSLRDLLDFSTERLISAELSRKRGLLLLRSTLSATLLTLSITNSHGLVEMVIVDAILALFLLLNIGLAILQEEALRSALFEFSLGLLDTALISYIVYRADPSGVLCLFFFLLLLTTAASNRMTQILTATFTLGGLYLLVHISRAGIDVLQSTSHLMVLPFLYAAGLYYGYQVLHIRRHQEHVDLVFRERQEFKIILDVLESVSSSLDFHTVMHRIVRRIAHVLDAMRCSLVLIEENDKTRGSVIASSDDPRITRLPLNLSKYPEIQKAIRSKQSVLIKDVERSNILKPLAGDLLRLKVRSLLVLPVFYRDTVIGTLLLRAAKKRGFNADDLRLCRAIASAAASPIKNSLLFEDVQRRAHAEEETAARLRSLFDHSPELILQLDGVGNIHEVNGAVERLTGRTCNDVLSLRLESLLRGLPRAAELVESVGKADGPLSYEATARSGDGRELQFSVTVGPISGPTGGLILIAHDVTDSKRAVESLQQSQKLSSIGEIVASVAHELNNPLAGIVGFSQLLARKPGAAQFQRETDRIIQSADQCQKIVRKLLSFARSSSAEKRPLGLNGVLDKTLDLLEAPLADTVVVREYDRELPFIDANFQEIQQVLTNLINNAQQAMSGQGGARQLTLTTYSRDGSVVLEVADTGSGIPPDILPRVFDPFFSTKEEGRGTGLGLSVSYGIVRDHGGDLEVESEPDTGTTFRVIFPRATSGIAEPHAEAKPIERPGSGCHILAVDDEPVIMDLYLDLLQALGHSVDTAGTGMEALRKIRCHDYDVILSDIKMPKMSGIELYKKTTEAKPRMGRRFVFVTGDTTFLSGDQASALQEVPCLLKPVSLAEIEKTINALLAGRRPTSDLPAHLQAESA